MLDIQRSSVQRMFGIFWSIHLNIKFDQFYRLRTNRLKKIYLHLFFILYFCVLFLSQIFCLRTDQGELILEQNKDHKLLCFA